jgi:hypothetical protein
MKQLLFLIIILPFVFLLGLSLRDEPEESLTEDKKIAALLEDMTFNTPKTITVLLNTEHNDNATRQRVKTIVLKTNEEYLPRTPRIQDKSQAVIGLLKKEVPNYDFGAPINEQGSYFRWLTPNGEWTASSVETSLGNFSIWERRAEFNELRVE